jgi:phage gpG-like protein
MARQTLIQQSRRVPPSQKATYHQLTGAGKSQIKREFFGLTPDDETVIAARIQRELQRVIDGR